MPDPLRSPLLTDLYQLTMLQGYLDHGMTDIAVFELFVRKLPENRQFLLAAGLEQALQFLEGLQLSGAELDWLRSTGKFNDTLLDYLADWTFSGEVHAMAEGTPFFPDEPILRVTAPLPEAQLVESRLINILHYQTLIASKAARCVLAAPDKLLVDFGLRRAHGAEAGLLAARASYLAGFAGTATVMAEMEFGIPTFGTMAHSYIEAHDSEETAFLNFSRSRPQSVVLLIDTYDTEAAARQVVELAPRLEEEGIAIQSVRIDSGDLVEHAARVREILDAGGLQGVGIFSSGSLDEYELKALLDAGAPIDGFGVGTHLDTSEDVPYLDCAYKLEEYAGKGRRKRSEHKATWPGRKQVFRYYDADGRMCEDVLTREDDPHDGEPLLHAVMRNGQRVAPAEPLDTIRQRVQTQLGRLPTALLDQQSRATYPVVIADALKALAAEVDAQIGIVNG